MNWRGGRAAVGKTANALAHCEEGHPLSLGWAVNVLASPLFLLLLLLLQLLLLGRPIHTVRAEFRVVANLLT